MLLPGGVGRARNMINNKAWGCLPRSGGASLEERDRARNVAIFAQAVLGSSRPVVYLSPAPSCGTRLVRRAGCACTCDILSLQPLLKDHVALETAVVSVQCDRT